MGGTRHCARCEERKKGKTARSAPARGTPVPPLRSYPATARAGVAVAHSPYPDAVVAHPPPPYPPCQARGRGDTVGLHSAVPPSPPRRRSPPFSFSGAAVDLLFLIMIHFFSLTRARLRTRREVPVRLFFELPFVAQTLDFIFSLFLFTR